LLDIDPSNNRDHLLKKNRIENIVEFVIVDILNYIRFFKNNSAIVFGWLSNRCNVARSYKKSRKK